jgi:hypothetical protein
LIDVNGDLLGAALRSYVLCARQLRAPAVPGKADQVLGHQRHRSPRAFLPRGVRRRVNDYLTDDSPACMVGIAARDQEARQRLGNPHCLWLGPVAVEVAQRGTHATAVLNRPCELAGSLSRLAWFDVDCSTVLQGRCLAQCHVEGRRIGVTG